MTPDERVELGATVLDRHGPSDWRSRVDLESFDVRSQYQCVLGQVYREEARRIYPYADGYTYGRDELMRAVDVPKSRVVFWTVSHGFEEIEEIAGRGYAKLDEAWRRYLTETRA